MPSDTKPTFEIVVPEHLIDSLEQAAADATLNWSIDDPIVGAQYPQLWTTVVEILTAAGRHGPTHEEDLGAGDA